MNELGTERQSQPVPAVRCSSLVKRFGTLLAVNHLSLEVLPGECFGLLGPNGAGKTTTLEMLEGLTRADEGSVEILGMTWTRSGDSRLREHIGVALQETRLPEKLTVSETIRLFRSFYRKGRSLEEVIEMLDLAEKRSTLVGKLSGGQRQRLALACAVVGNPDILFLDEPTTGLDPQARHRIWDVIDGFVKSGGTVLVTTHYMDEAERLCDRVAIVDHGTCIAVGTPRELVAGLNAQQMVEFVAGDGTLKEEALQGIPGITSISRRDGLWKLHVQSLDIALPALLDRLGRLSVSLEHLVVHGPTLEDVFIQLTGRALRDG